MCVCVYNFESRLELTSRLKNKTGLKYLDLTYLEAKISDIQSDYVKARESSNTNHQIYLDMDARRATRPMALPTL